MAWIRSMPCIVYGDITKNMLSFNSLKKRREFVHTAQNGQKWVSTGLILQAAPNGQDEHIGYGLTITKKIYKRAVKRNRIRRRMRALAHDVLQELALPGYNYVLIGRTETLDKPYTDLSKDLKWCLKRLNLLKDMP